MAYRTDQTNPVATWAQRTDPLTCLCIHQIRENPICWVPTGGNRYPFSFLSTNQGIYFRAIRHRFSARSGVVCTFSLWTKANAQCASEIAICMPCMGILNHFLLSSQMAVLHWSTKLLGLFFSCGACARLLARPLIPNHCADIFSAACSQRNNGFKKRELIE